MDINLDIAFKFAEWLGTYYIKVQDGWITKYSNTLQVGVRTTEDLFKQFNNSEG
jgi:hypothetical protein